MYTDTIHPTYKEPLFTKRFLKEHNPDKNDFFFECKWGEWSIATEIAFEKYLERIAKNKKMKLI